RISAPLTSSVDGLLELRAGRELRDVRRLDLHLLAGARVYAHPLGAPGDVELAEPGERDGVTGLQRALDDTEGRVDGRACVALRQVCLVGDGIHELLLGHANPPWSMVCVSA